MIAIAFFTALQSAAAVPRKPPFQPLLSSDVWKPPAKALNPVPIERQPATSVVTLGPEKFSVTTYSMETVTVKGGNSALPVTETLRAQFANAAYKATGCLMRNMYWTERALSGDLDCTGRIIR